MERTAPIFIVMNAAAQSELEINDLLASILQQRLTGMQHFTTALRAHTPLRRGLDRVRVAETVWALTSPEVFTLLTGKRGWPVDE